MARIDISTIRKIEKERNQIQEKVFTTYCTFEKEGQRFLQIDTYGRGTRANPEKISQAIQFDKESATFFIELLKKEFEL